MSIIRKHIQPGAFKVHHGAAVSDPPVRQEAEGSALTSKPGPEEAEEEDDEEDMEDEEEEEEGAE